MNFNSRKLGGLFFLLAILISRPLTFGFSETAKSAKPVIALGLAEQLNAPAKLIETTHTMTDLLSAAKLRNLSSEAIVAYRVAYKIISSGEQKLVQGVEMNVPAGLAPKTQMDVPSQGFGSPRQVGAPARVVFYVSEVKFASGDVWQANASDVK